MRYQIRIHETGTVIVDFETFEEAYCELSKYENDDMEEETYEFGAYEIYDVYLDKIVW